MVSNEERIPLSVLIVDDNQSKIAQVRETILSCSENVTIEIAFDSIEGQRKLLKTKFDLLILDMELPMRSEDGDISQKNGKYILEDLFSDDSYKMPGHLIILTEYVNIRDKMRDEFPDVAVIIYDESSSKWQEGIKRKMTVAKRAKSSLRQIVYCEGENDQLYNLIGFENVEFRGLSDCRAIYLAAKNELEKFALRDRDFLTNYEIKKIQSLYKNYLVLDYYCFENYLFHPDNIFEVDPFFDRNTYFNDIHDQKEAKLLTIIQDYKLARNAYFDLNDHDKKNLDRNPEDEIVTMLKSKDFETFYPFFDMAGKKDKENKKSYDRSMLANLNLDKSLLVRTKWMKNKIGALLLNIPS